jgi:hypothetical protein
MIKFILLTHDRKNNLIGVTRKIVIILMFKDYF